MPLKISIVIPTHNRIEKLLRELDSIFASDFKNLTYEIIVIDDLSSDNTEARIRSKYPEVIVIRTTNHVFSSGARKLGVANAKGTYLFFLDDDNILDKNCIANLCSFLDSNASYGMVAPLMMYYDSQKIWCAGAVVDSWLMPHNLFHGKDVTDLPKTDRIDLVTYFPNAWMVRGSLFYEKKVDYDTKNFPHNWAEPDFGQQVFSAGYALSTVLSAVTYHDIGHSRLITRVTPETIVDQARSRIVYRRKYSTSLYQWIVFWLLIFPVSSFYYLMIMLSDNPKTTIKLLVLYFRGTFAGVTEAL